MKKSGCGSENLTKNLAECHESLKRPDPFEQLRRAPRDRAVWIKDFGVSGTLSQKWQPAGDRVNGSGSGRGSVRPA